MGNPRGYTTIALPDEMIAYIDELIKKPIIKAKYGYTSRADLIRAAVTKHLRELEEQLEPSIERRVPYIPRNYERIAKLMKNISPDIKENAIPILDIIIELIEKEGKAILIKKVIEIAEEKHSLDPKFVKSVIDELLNMGSAFEPEPGYIQLT